MTENTEVGFEWDMPCGDELIRMEIVEKSDKGISILPVDIYERVRWNWAQHHDKIENLDEIVTTVLQLLRWPNKAMKDAGPDFRKMIEAALK